ncbi:Aspartate ammonia-lyase [Penicillium digitatum PHI26]|uniref:Aspartate ammonia-lyase n=2 Tax=Penicillium digitatum TaxID=36651 RepID=K9GL61_PEND2|nr:Aspartate ammonia-lyase [Penicillium digitatum Pd1]EKV13906.1 Aspartate ammonia-lyase [Penicillium digitatum PHI26]EKV21500.1 Aspartate ammonia-lyase [Penicillium digitatum Pd1]
MANTRVEKDSLGQLELPAEVLYGINTSRSLDNFPLSGRSITTWPDFVYAFAIVKQAAARANCEIGSLTTEQGDAILQLVKKSNSANMTHILWLTCWRVQVARRPI